MNTLFIPVGIPGCGKSHYARAINATFVVSSDAIREQIAKDVNDQSKNAEVFEQFHKDIRANLRWASEFDSVYADATNLDSRARASLRAIQASVNDQGGRVVTHLLLFRNLEQAIRRNQDRDRVVPANVMMRMIEKHEMTVSALHHHEGEMYNYVTEINAVR